MRVCAVYDRIKIRYDKQKVTLIIMDKQTKKELLFFAAVFFGILIIGIMGGLLLFLLPFTLIFIELKYSAIVVCSVATFTAIQEGHFIRTGREIV